MNRRWTALPNFVDCTVFRPAADAAEKRRIRASLGIAPEAFVIGCVAAVKRHHKRIDCLIREVAGAGRVRDEGDGRRETGDERQDGVQALPHPASRLKSDGSPPPSPPFLLIAGARTGETDALAVMAESLLPGRHRILTDCTRERMPDLYRCMDVFVLTSLFEMMPIALLEALASGLPCLVNRHPVLEWMVGTGGERPETTDDRPQTPDLKARKDECGAHVSRSVVSSFPGGAALDMARDGALAETLAGLTPAWIADHGRLARERALRLFDKPVVIRQYVEYYERVIA